MTKSENRIKRWLVKFCVAFTVLTLCSIAYFATVGKAQLIESFLTQQNERWVSQYYEYSVQPSDVVFLGDSITEGGNWDELFPGLSVRNRGISGDVTAGVLKRLHQVADGRPAKVFLLIGTNDLDRDVSDGDIVRNIVRVADDLHAVSPDTELFVQSILPRAREYRERIEQLNSRLRLAIRGKAEWIDLYPLFLDPEHGSIRNDLSNDELHLLGAGYLLWRDTLEEYVSPLPLSSQAAKAKKI
jgi:hexosaminidase